MASRALQTHAIRVGEHMRLWIAVVGSALAAATVEAQAPYLVRDVNLVPYEGERDPRSLTAAASALYFVGGGDANAREIRRLDAALDLTLPLDLQPGGGNPNDEPTNMAAVGDILFFVFKQGLYRTDSTPAGTVLIRQFGFPRGIVDEMFAVEAGLFFVVETTLDRTLWWTDGTDSGTVPLALVSDSTSLTTTSGSRIYWTEYDPVTGWELWTSDATPAGTHMVEDICPGSCSGVEPGPGLLAGVGGVLYFVAYDGVHGPELWKSDGTALGTAMVVDAVPGPVGEVSGRLARFGNLVLYLTNDAISGAPSLWRSDGTPAGTYLLHPGVDPHELIDAGGIAFFDGIDSAHGREPWRTDGTPAGTAVVDMCPGPCDFFRFAPVMGSAPGILLFVQGPSEVWRSDGTVGGTFPIRTFSNLPRSFTRFAGAAFFGADDGQTNLELWRSDGSVAGTQIVHNAASSSSWISGLGHVGDRFFFDALRPDLGPELWSTTGTAPSTTYVDLLPGPTGEFPVTWTALPDRILLATQDDLSNHIWSSDGTASGTTLLSTARARRMSAGDGLAFFEGGVPSDNREPWRSDGAPGGTFPLGELHPGAQSSFPQRFVAHAGQMYFMAAAANAFSLWRSDGTTGGTTEIVPRECAPMASVGETLYLQCTSLPGPIVQLWATDGTTDGTRFVKDVAPPPSNGPIDAAELDGILYFPASDAAGGLELWRSDATTAGTYRVKDIVPGTEGATPSMLTSVGGAVYFIATTPGAGSELWRSDGTDAGTVMVRDVNPGPGSGVFEIEGAGGQLLLAAYTPASGVEPWRSDGTSGGTVPLAEIAPGPSSSVPFDMHAVGGRIYFAADDGVTGTEPWAVNMPAGAVSVADVLVPEGDAGALDATFEVRLQSASNATVQVAYATVAGSAQAGVDFQPRSGVLTFTPGMTVATVPVPVLGDLQDEADEAFRLQLSPVGNTVIADRSAFAVIQDDDAPRLTVANATVTEGNSGTTGASFVVTLTTHDGAATPNAKTLAYATAPVTATSGVDFVATSGVLTFPPGTPSGATASVTVAINGDLVDEPDETFELRLAATSDATIPATPAFGLIEDDDGIDSAPPTELTHGVRVRATLRPRVGRITDRDLYVLRQQPRTSYEVAVDETSGDAVPLEVRRMAADGSTVLQSGVAVGTGASVSLRWENTSDAAASDQHVRVESAACGTGCDDDDTYRLRFYETTLAGARFNNAGSQLTVVLLQNPTDAAIGGRVILWAADGFSSAEAPFTVPARGLFVLNTASVWPGASGSVTVTHDGPYGTLTGKAVALEPPTGFSFDTPLEYRPR